MSATKAPIWVVVRAHLRSDVRKTGVLVVLILAMVVVYARLFFKSGGTSTADASTTAVVPGVPAAGAQTRNAREDHSVPAERMTLSAPLFRKLARDPFAVDLGKFPFAAGAGQRMSDPPLGADAGDREEAIRAAASELVFQGIIYDGHSSIACINGQVVRPGQQIAGFVVKRVEPMRIVLQYEDVQVVLNLR